MSFFKVNVLIRSLYNRFPLIPFKKLYLRASDYYISINRNKKIITKIDGITYQLDLLEQIDSAIYYFGSFDRETAYAIKKILKKGMIALDIGANIGAYTFIMAELVGETGKIIAFEPILWAFLKLKRNNELNNFQNIVLEKIALSNESGKKLVLFKTSWVLEGISKENSLKKELIQFTTLDDYLNKKRIEKIDFIKLDVDGYEFKVLRGAINTLKKNMPVIILEVGINTLERIGDKLEDMISFLSNMGYKFYSDRDFIEISNFEKMKDLIPRLKCINVIVSVNPL